MRPVLEPPMITIFLGDELIVVDMIDGFIAPLALCKGEVMRRVGGYGEGAEKRQERKKEVLSERWDI